MNDIVVVGGGLLLPVNKIKSIKFNKNKYVVKIIDSVEEFSGNFDETFTSETKFVWGRILESNLSEEFYFIGSSLDEHGLIIRRNDFNHAKLVRETQQIVFTTNNCSYTFNFESCILPNGNTLDYLKTISKPEFNRFNDAVIALYSVGVY